MLLVVSAGCGVRVADPCATLSGTCLAVHVDPWPGAAQVEALTLRVVGDGIDARRPIERDRSSRRAPAATPVGRS